MIQFLPLPLHSILARQLVWPGFSYAKPSYAYPTPASLSNPHQITFCLHFSNQKRECDNSNSRGRLSDCLFVQSKTQFRGPHSDATDSAPD